MRVLSAILSLLGTQPHSASTLRVFISSASLVSLAGIGLIGYGVLEIQNASP